MIKLENLHKYYDRQHVLKGIDLSVEKGEVVAVLGPSGSGKSTLLRCINFLEEPTSGIVEIGGKRVDAAAAKKKKFSRSGPPQGWCFSNTTCSRI